MGADIQGIVAEAPDLPEIVRSVPFAHVESKNITKVILSKITTRTLCESPTRVWVNRLNRRRQALLPYIGRTLNSVLNKLPGINYTLEIDPEFDRVIRWESQIGLCGAR